MCKTIGIINMKGGVAKTTTSINLAAGLAAKGKRVLLIDLDPQANSTDILLDIKQEDIYFDEDVMNAINNMDSKLLKEKVLELNDYEYKEVFIDQMLVNPELITSYQTKVDNLDIIPSRLELANVEKSMRNGETATHNRLLKIIKAVRGEYDYVIIDCPPIINLLTVNVLHASEEILVPIKIDRAAEKGLIMTLTELISIAGSYDLDILVRPLFTMVNRNNVHKSRIEKIMQLENDIVKPIQQRIRFQDKPVSDSSYKNELVISNDKTGVGQDYQAFVEELLTIWEV